MLVRIYSIAKNIKFIKVFVFKLELENTPLLTSFAKSNDEEQIENPIIVSEINYPEKLIISDDCNYRTKMLKSTSHKHRPEFEMKKHRKHKKKKKHKKHRKNIYEVVSTTQVEVESATQLEAAPSTSILDENKLHTLVNIDFSKQSLPSYVIETEVKDSDLLNPEEEELTSRDDDYSNYSNVNKVS